MKAIFSVKSVQIIISRIQMYSIQFKFFLADSLRVCRSGHQNIQS